MKVAVIGAGVIGLSTAIILARRGYKVIIYTESVTIPETASLAAGAHFIPFHPGDRAKPELEKRIVQVSYDEFKKIAKKHRWITRARHTEVWKRKFPDPYWKDIVGSFKAYEFTDGPPRYVYAWDFTTFFIPMRRYMKWLMGEFKHLGGSVIIRRINRGDLVRLPEKFIFNCSGLGSRELAGDDTMIPIKGEINILNKTKIKKGFADDYFAIMPQYDSIIVGCGAKKNDDSTGFDREIHLWVEKKALEWGKSAWARKAGLDQILTNLNGGEIITGVRPYRPAGVRLERERLKGGVEVYHDYGHGGCGITFSWGSAIASVEQFEKYHKRDIQK